jgi:hypothetical protein
MSNSTVMIADMGILVGIFLLGLLAKLFPKKTENSHPNEHTSFVGDPDRGQGSGIRNRAGSR